jgi:3-oxoacyl-[acyl-carrier protein] reductase
MKLINKVAVITGGAGQIGYATATKLAHAGARIFLLVRRNLDEAQQLVNKLPNQQLGHQVLLADVKNSEQVSQAAQLVAELSGRCDILVNSAAIALHPPNILDLPNDQFDEIVAINLKGPWLMVKEFHSLLKKTGDGLVVNISSVASVRTRPTSTFYSMTKAGLNAMTESLAKAFAPEIRVVAIAPGLLEKPVSGYPFVSDNEFSKFKISDSVYKSHLEVNPTKRLCTADDVASAIESLATKIKFYNGHLFMLDGGITL